MRLFEGQGGAHIGLAEHVLSNADQARSLGKHMEVCVQNVPTHGVLMQYACTYASFK